MAESEEKISVRELRSIADPERFLGHNVYLTDDLSNEYYETWSIPSFPSSPNDIYHEVSSGQEGLRGLTYLSYKYYGRPDLWWVIAVANGIALPTRDVNPGVVLRIPSRNAVYFKLIEVV